MLSKELQLLIAFSGTTVTSDNKKWVEQLDGININWDLFINLSFQHRVMPLVYKNLRKYCARIIPVEVLSRIRKYYLDNTARNFFVTDKMLKILDELRRNNIIAVSFKGAVFTENIYGHVGLRQFVDIDILINKRDVLPACRILEDNGYNLELNINEGKLRKYIHHEDSIAAYNEKVDILIELHWDMSGNYSSVPICFEDINDSIEHVILSGEEVLNISPEFLLVYLCIHGSKHCWNTLDSICCIAELIKSRPEIEWAKAEKISREFQCERMFKLGLFLATDLLNADIPYEFIVKIEKDPKVKKLAASIKKKLFSEIDTTREGIVQEEFSRFHIQIRDNRANGIKYMMHLVFLPTIADWHNLTLTRNFTFLYYFYRPIRLFREYFKRLAFNISR